MHDPDTTLSLPREFPYLLEVVSRRCGGLPNKKQPIGKVVLIWLNGLQKQRDLQNLRADTLNRLPISKKSPVKPWPRRTRSWNRSGETTLSGWVGPRFLCWGFGNPSETDWGLVEISGGRGHLLHCSRMRLRLYASSLEFQPHPSSPDKFSRSNRQELLLARRTSSCPQCLLLLS